MRKKVLVAGEYEWSRQSLATMLIRLGLEVETAANGTEAFERLESGDFLILFSDIKMPGMDGIDLLKRVRSVQPRIRVVMVTGTPTLGIAIDAFRNGASDFVTKPINYTHIEKVVNRLVKEVEVETENLALPINVLRKKEVDELNQQLQERLNELSIMNAINEVGSPDPLTSGIFERITEIAAEIAGTRDAAVMILDPETGGLRVKSICGMDLEQGRTISGANPDSILGRVVKSCKPILGSIAGAKEMGEYYDGGRELFALPMMAGGEVFGVLSVLGKRKGTRFTQKQKYLLETLTKKVSMRVENVALHRSLQESFVASLEMLVNTLEARDESTKNHSMRVTNYAVSIAEKMGLTRKEVEDLQLGCSIHDIGKIGIHDDILLKQGRLSQEEYEVMKSHPVIGTEMVEGVVMLRQIAPLIRNHHEHFDGSGYPDGLADGEIPRSVRILSCADAFDAMTTNRPYRRNLPQDVALGELKKYAGRQFDPEVVEALHDVVTLVAP